jgi:hypothetical protein
MKPTLAVILFAAAATAAPQFHFDRDTPICDKAHLAMGPDKGDATLVYCMEPPKTLLKGRYTNPADDPSTKH